MKRLLILAMLTACGTLADEKEPPSPAEVRQIISRIDAVRATVLRHLLDEVDDVTKDIWLRVLRELGNGRARLLRLYGVPATPAETRSKQRSE